MPLLSVRNYQDHIRHCQNRLLNVEMWTTVPELCLRVEWMEAVREYRCYERDVAFLAQSDPFI